MKLRLDNSAICTCFVVYFNLSQYLFTHELKYIMVSHFCIGQDLWNVGSLLRKKCNLCHLEMVKFQRSKLQCALCTFISLLYSKNRLFDSCAIDSFCINSLKINITPYNWLWDITLLDYPQKCLPQNCLPVGKSEVGIIIITHHQKCLP